MTFDSVSASMVAKKATFHYTEGIKHESPGGQLLLAITEEEEGLSFCRPAREMGMSWRYW
jgi:hypothetical protein